jgi:hypothetical protein
MNLISAYVEGKYIGSFEHTFENVAKFINGVVDDEEYVLVDENDDFILSTFGCYIDEVFSEYYRRELLKFLVPLQMSGEVTEVQLVSLEGVSTNE